MISTKKLNLNGEEAAKTSNYDQKKNFLVKNSHEKGHFVVYTSDKRRFMSPLAYLKSDIFVELFKMAEEEFGVVASGPIVLPCDSSFMEYAISIIQRHVAEGLEKTFDYVLDYLQMLWFLNLKQPCEQKREGEEKKFRRGEEYYFYFIICQKL